MLRPKRMSRVSVTGTRDVMRDVVEAVHDLNAVHLVDYAGEWAEFEPGDPMERADELSEWLVTVRSIESILGVDPRDVEPGAVVADEEMEPELESIRDEVNALDDRRAELRDRLRSLDERIADAGPFVDLGIDLDLLSKYDSLAVRVGEGDISAVEAALADLDAPARTFAGDRAVAAVAAVEVAALDEALVGVEFTAVAVPDASGPPDDYVADLEREREDVEADLEEIEAELDSLKLDAARFLLAAEEHLTIETQKTEAPLAFATTEHAFVAEGWIPTERYPELASRLEAAAGDHIDVEELERADYDADGVAEHTEPAGEAVTDGGDDAIGHASPPVVQDNPDALRPFEVLVRTIARPRYSELDPTLLVFLTFPTFFGFMIGDLGYGIFYTLVSYLMVTRLDSPGLKSLGGVAMWAGFFTMLFGVLYGEVFGLHVLGEIVWGGHPPIEKGLNVLEFALLWLFGVMILGLAHVGTGYVLDFVNTAQHSVTDAILESASWFMLMFGVWIWILSRHLRSAKPGFIFELSYHGDVIFSGLPASVGLAALAVAAVGFVLMLYDEYRHLGGVAMIIGPLESLNVLVNVLSYARITAVLLAKAGMAFVVNLLFFGAYEHDGATHFMISETPAHVAQELGCATVAGCEAISFPGLIHGGVAAIGGGLLVLVLGHAVVWSLGITSAGLQAIRLEYVEFFQKFYEGGGEPYRPFGHARRYTADE